MSGKKQALKRVTYDREHLICVKLPDGSTAYPSTLFPGRAAAASNWSTYTSTLEAARILGGRVMIQEVTDA